MSLPREVLVPFLIRAKRSTYAGQGDDATVPALLPGAKQLEWREGRLLYRDVYFGMSRFVGQEVVYDGDLAVWAMSYSGGIVLADAVPAVRSGIYAFLRAALSAVTEENPFRGPATFQDATHAYSNDHHGDLDDFWGVEVIRTGPQVVYELRFAGGAIS